MTNGLTVLKNQPNTKLKGNVQMGDHIAQLNSHFSRVTAIGSEIKKRMKVAIILSLFSEQQECAYKIALVHIIQEGMAEWSYVTSIFIEESRYLKAGERHCVIKMKLVILQ